MIKSIEVANVVSTDVIVVESDQVLSLRAVENIETRLKQVWPNRKIMVLSGGLRMRVAREA